MIGWPLPGGSAAYPIGPGGTSEDHQVRGVGPAIDIPAPFGTTQYPSVSGQVVLAGWIDDQAGISVDYEGWQDGHQWKFRHCHLDQVYVRVGDPVQQGATPLGTVGLTGNTTGPHIHQVAWMDGVRVRPEDVYAAFGGAAPVPDPGNVGDPGGGGSAPPFPGPGTDPDVAAGPVWSGWAPAITAADVENALNVIWGWSGELANRRTFSKAYKLRAAKELRDAAQIFKKVANQ